MSLKDLFKRYFLILKVRNHFSGQIQITQRQLFHYYQEKVRANNPVRLTDTGFRVFSQFEEDGMLLYIFSVIGMGSGTFVEIGSDDGINSNCANLVFNFGWNGLFIDKNAESIRRGRRFYAKYPHPWMHKPQFWHGEVTPDNINSILESCEIKGEIELLSVDIDGDDYWIWNAIEIIQPKVVIIETHVRFGLNNIVVPYPNRSRPNYEIGHGASPIAMAKLGRRKGYSLIGANQLGFNLFFLKEALVSEMLPEVDVSSVLRHPSVSKAMADFRMSDPTDYATPIP